MRKRNFVPLLGRLHQHCRRRIVPLSDRATGIHGISNCTGSEWQVEAESQVLRAPGTKTLRGSSKHGLVVVVHPGLALLVHQTASVPPHGERMVIKVSAPTHLCHVPAHDPPHEASRTARTNRSEPQLPEVAWQSVQVPRLRRRHAEVACVMDYFQAGRRCTLLQTFMERLDNRAYIRVCLRQKSPRFSKQDLDGCSLGCGVFGNVRSWFVSQVVVMCPTRDKG